MDLIERTAEVFRVGGATRGERYPTVPVYVPLSKSASTEVDLYSGIERSLWSKHNTLTSMPFNFKANVTSLVLLISTAGKSRMVHRCYILYMSVVKYRVKDPNYSTEFHASYALAPGSELQQAKENTITSPAKSALQYNPQC